MPARRIIFFLVTILLVLCAVFAGVAGTGFAQNVTLSGLVPPQSPDFQFDYTSKDNVTNVKQNDIITYQITYGAHPSAALTTNNTITARFDPVFPNGSRILDYIHGSATTGYGNSKPIIDWYNRTITWNISSLPAGTVNQRVFFQLIATSNYTGPTVVNFTTYADMNNQYTTMPQKQINQTFRYVESQSASSNNTPPPQQENTPTSTPQPTPIPLRIIDLSFTEITGSKATVSVTTTNPSRLSVNYGTDPENMSKAVNTTVFSRNSLIDLTELSPDTAYFLQIRATDEARQTLLSEIYTFTTAKGDISEIPRESAVAIGSGNIVVPVIVGRGGDTRPLVVITEDTDYRLTYLLLQSLRLENIDTVFKNRSGDRAPVSAVPLFEQEKGLFAAGFRAAKAGYFDIFARIRDIHGNLKEQKIAEIKVIPRLRVYEEKDGRPIGDARVFLYYFNRQSGKYEPLDRERFGNIANPQFTDIRGELRILLPTGRYKAVASALGHSEREVEFSLGKNEGEEFPQIGLTKDYYNMYYLTRFIKDWLADSFNRLTENFEEFSQSVRFFNVVAGSTVVSFSIISLILFSARSRLHPKFIPVFFLFHMHLLFGKHKKRFFYGTVTDKSGKPLSKSRVEIVDQKTGNVLTHVVTGKTGHFYFPNKFNNPIRVRIEKEGFNPEEVPTEAVLSDSEIKIELESGKENSLSNSALIRISEHLLGAAFETFLLASIVLQLIFISVFGILSTLPYIILSAFNILLWLFFLKELNRVK
jgi:hypothetical protein